MLMAMLKRSRPEVVEDWQYEHYFMRMENMIMMVSAILKIKNLLVTIIL